MLGAAYLNLSLIYTVLNKLDSALMYATMAEKIYREREDRIVLSVALVYKGNIYFKKGLEQEATACYYEAIHIQKNELF